MAQAAVNKRTQAHKPKGYAWLKPGVAFFGYLHQQIKRILRALKGKPWYMRTWDELNEEEKREIKQHMMQTWEEMNNEFMEATIDELKEEVLQQFNALNQSLRGGNGDE